MALGLTQTLTEMSTRSIFWCVRLTTYHHPVPLSRNLGILTSWNPLGHSSPVMGLIFNFLKDSVTGYTRLDKIKSEVIRKELEISGIQDVRLKYKQNWINHLERMDNTRLLKHALNYKPRGRRDRGRPRKRWQCVDAGTGQTT